MTRVSQAEDCWNIVTALSLLLTPFRSSVLEPDLFLNKTKIQCCPGKHNMWDCLSVGVGQIIKIEV